MKVSVVIPAYNAAPFLAEAVASAQQQGEVVAEIIIVNNNSTDTTQAVAESLFQQLPTLVKLATAKKQGCSAARNIGMKLATSEWIQFLDADDLLLSGKLLAQSKLVNPRIDWIIAGYQHQYPDGEVEVSLPHADPWKGLTYNFAIGNTCANLYRKSTLMGLGGWPEEFPDNTDHHLHFRLLKANARFQFDPEIRMVYRHFNQDRVSIRQPVKRLERKVYFHRLVNQYLKEHRPEYWQIHQAHFDSTLIRALRMLATHNLPLATQLFQQFYPIGLPKMDANIVSSIPRLYPYLGFQNVEQARKTLARWLPANLKAKLK